MIEKKTSVIYIVSRDRNFFIYIYFGFNPFSEASKSNNCPLYRNLETILLYTIFQIPRFGFQLGSDVLKGISQFLSQSVSQDIRYAVICIGETFHRKGARLFGRSTKEPV